jgi:ATP/maltotriose-dependent transcriptional regulator MalT
LAASAAQPKAPPVDRRIIERPRLIKLLDETDAHTILLLAPAGYGKTTLARQWAKTLNGAIWVTLSQAHRDVAVIATDLARTLDPEGRGALAFVATYIKAQSNPQRVAREIALVVAEQLRKVHVQWVVFDDYHEVSSEPSVECFVEVLNETLASRVLIASRLRPAWATARLAVYGDILELTRGDLALDAQESRAILGCHPDHEYVAAQAEGWPALIGLAASARLVRRPGQQLQSNLLHDYFAEELFKSATRQLQRQLMKAAVAPDLRDETLARVFGSRSSSFVDAAHQIGFINVGEDGLEFHPLLRDFLLAKLTKVSDVRTIIDASVQACIEEERWERAFDLILRFERADLVEPVLDAAYSPLIRCGQVATLAAFAAKIRAAPAFPPAAIDLAEADVALADGAFDLASRVARRAESRLPNSHHLKSHASKITAASAFARAQLTEAEAAYRRAFETAQSAGDELDALRGWALSSLQSETPVPPWVIERIEAHRLDSPLDLVRNTILQLTRLHFTTGYRDVTPLLQEAERVLARVEDPRARSSFNNVAAYVTGLTGRYQEAVRWQRLCDTDITDFDLDFARPHSHWNNGHHALGLRRFGAAERLLQQLEDSISSYPLDYHVLNARILRGRLALETGRVQQALALLPAVRREVVIPSIHGEYVATRGLALAVSGLGDAAEVAHRAVEVTSAVEVRVLAMAVEAITTPKPKQESAACALWETAEALNVWDPVIFALRSSAPLAATLAGVDSLREQLASLYQHSNDLGLARRAGLRTRAVQPPDQLLSPRELEVLGLMAHGYRNKDIAEALVVSPSTVKVHARHIFEKLGVRSRSQAVARLQALDQAITAASAGSEDAVDGSP